MSNKQSLIGYCGLYCGACAIYQQMIRKRATQLLEVLDAYQFREIAKEAKEWEISPFSRSILFILSE